MPTVLLAEDDLQARVTMTTRLRDSGLQVRPAPNVAQLRERVYGGAVTDAVIVSAEFQGSTGGDWLAELARLPRWRGVPVIAATSSPDSIFAWALRRSGMPVLAKPASAIGVRIALHSAGILLPPDGPVGLFLESFSLRHVYPTS